MIRDLGGGQSVTVQQFLEQLVCFREERKKRTADMRELFADVCFALPQVVPSSSGKPKSVECV